MPVLQREPDAAARAGGVVQTPVSGTVGHAWLVAVCLLDLDLAELASLAGAVAGVIALIVSLVSLRVTALRDAEVVLAVAEVPDVWLRETAMPNITAHLRLIAINEGARAAALEGVRLTLDASHPLGRYLGTSPLDYRAHQGFPVGIDGGDAEPVLCVGEFGPVDRAKVAEALSASHDSGVSGELCWTFVHTRRRRRGWRRTTERRTGGPARVDFDLAHLRASFPGSVS